jgi:hypothetical protein
VSLTYNHYITSITKPLWLSYAGCEDYGARNASTNGWGALIEGSFHDQWFSDKLLSSGPSTSHSLNVLGSIPQKQFDRNDAIAFGIAR